MLDTVIFNMMTKSNSMVMYAFNVSIVSNHTHIYIPITIVSNI